MIRVYLKNVDKDLWRVTLPHEINNEFLSNAGRAARSWDIKWVSDIPSFNDFWAPVEYWVSSLDKLYQDFEVLEKNLDKIVEIVSLPRKIWWWEWYNRQFISFNKDWIKEIKKYFPKITEQEISDIIHRENMIQELTSFTRNDMLLIISLIKKKILEAKEKWETLVFSGD